MRKKIAKKNFKKISILLLILGIILTVMVFLKGDRNLFSPRPFKYIILDINPCLEFVLDKNDKIKEVISLNEEADLILEGTPIVNKSVEEGTVLFLQKAVSTGYLNQYDIDNKLTVIAYASDNHKEEEIKEKVIERAEAYFRLKIIHVDIIGKERERKTKLLAKKKKVNYGKILMINKMKELDNSLVPDKLIKLSHKKIQTILRSLVDDRYGEDRFYQEEYKKYILKQQALLIEKTKEKEKEVIKEIIANYDDYENKIPPTSNKQLKIQELLKVRKREIVEGALLKEEKK